ncbi:hypothetical protein MTR_2g043170 [Medicago truncatula]|uniref:Defensin-like protein n=1 Tax=Medicago truncatula TaxID=3880 RepID=A0A072V6A4_MEDTR|nr:hypothetical protein MTR_2g043170 [Medicago truncatula]
MANHFSIWFNFLVILATIAADRRNGKVIIKLTHISGVQLTVEGGQCSEIYDSCAAGNCNDYCRVLYGVNIALGSFCDDSNMCTCLYKKESSTYSCNMGLGACIKGNCDSSCCNVRCASKFKHAKGDCNQDRCVCHYIPE